jgi:hypothetical protein
MNGYKSIMGLLLVTAATACGTPGPGMILDVAAKQYRSHETDLMNKSAAEFLISQQRTSRITGVVIYRQDITTAYMRRYLINLSGKAGSREDVEFAKSAIVPAIGIDASKCEFKIDVDYDK